MRKRGNGSFLFPDTLKYGNVIFHYSKGLNASFVNKVKGDIDLVKKKMVSIKGVKLTDIDKLEPIHIYVYPNIKTFRQALGSALQQIETAQMHYMKSKSIETNYIIQDDEGNIHLVLPDGRSLEVLDNFSAEIVAKVYSSYVSLNEPKRNELRNTVRSYVKANTKKIKEEQAKQNEEKEEAEVVEEIEDEEVLEELEETTDELDEIQKDNNVPEWLIIGWEGYVKSTLNNDNIRRKFSQYLTEKKMTSPSKLNKSTLKSSEVFDREIAIVTVEYICNTYGNKTYLKFCNDYTNYKIFGENMTKHKFNDEVKAYIKANYIIDKSEEIKTQYALFPNDETTMILNLQTNKEIVDPV